MHCLSCDAFLTDYEATRKSASGHYVDLCNACFRHIKHDIVTFARHDLEGVVDDIVTDFHFERDMDNAYER